MEKQTWEESGWISQEVRRSEKRKSEKQEDAGARKGRKVTIHCVFPMIWGSGGSKSNLAKGASAEPAGQMRDERLHAVVARSTCPSENVENTPASEHFEKLRCRKSARRRRCGTEHISKSKCTKHTMFGPLLEVEMSKKCAPLARSTFVSKKGKNTSRSDHFWKLRCRKNARRCGAKHMSKSKCTKHHSQTTFGSCDVEKVHAVVARSTFPSQKCKKLTCSDHFWTFRCRKSARCCGAKHISKSKV